MKYRNLLAVVLLSSLSFSCVNDDSEIGGATFPEVSISGSELTTMQIFSVDLGTPCVITPNLVYENGCQPSDLKYLWSIGSYNTESQVKGELKEVSTEPVFNYVFPQGGSYYVHLNVTNGLSGDVIDYQVNVDRSFEEGVLIVSENEAGIGNISFIKTLTEEEIAGGKQHAVLEHCVASMNEGIDMRGLLGAGSTMLQYGSSERTFIVALKDKSYLLDPSTFALVATSNYTEAMEGYEASSFFMYDYYGGQPTLFSKDKKRMMQIDRQFGYAFIPSSAIYQIESDCVLPGYTYFTSQDWYMNSPIGIRYAASEVYSFGGYSEMKWTLNDRDIISAFKNTAQYSSDIFVISRKSNDPNVLCQEHCTIEYDADYNVSFVALEMEHELTEGEVLPEKETVFCYDQTYNVCYYITNGKLYAYYPNNPELSFPTTATLDFGAEEVTSVTLNEMKKELYIGTYDSVTKRGSVYIYDSGNVKKDKEKLGFKACTDKIKHISYKKRSL